jgi:8-oxo-dGTP diphosphatase
MAQIMLPDSEFHGKITVLDLDIDKDLPPGDDSRGSTYNLAKHIQQLYPDYDIKIVIGEDNLEKLDQWHKAEDLMKEFSFIVITRVGETLLAPKDCNLEIMQYWGRGSSTHARDAIYVRDWDKAVEHVSGSVLAYIKYHGLYAPRKLVTGGPDLLPDGSNYDKNAYQKAANTVDIAIVRLNGANLEVLLIKRKWNPCQGMWALPGGFVEIAKNEPLEAAALRELNEETGVVGIPVKQLATYGDPGRDCRDRVISTVYYALLPQGAMDDQKVKALDDADDYQWRGLNKSMHTADLAFDHAKILWDLMDVFIKEAKTTPIPIHLMPEHFTWKQLEYAYTAMLGYKPSNIRRKLRSLYKIVPIGTVKGSRHRPASLFMYQGENNGI